MRKLKYSVDCSLDGFIAREDHAYDFLLSEGEHMNAFLASLKNFDIALMGRKTYEVGLEAGTVDPSLNIKQYVISSSLTGTIDDRIGLISSHAGEFVSMLKKQEGKDILLSGGSILAAALLAERLIDEIALRVHPVLIGKGIPVFDHMSKDVLLMSVEQTPYENGVILLSYQVRY